MDNLPPDLAEGIRAAEDLQRAIDAALTRLRNELLHRIELDRGSEVVDLSLDADVRVFTSPAAEPRDFSVVSLAFLQNTVPKPDWMGRKQLDGMFTTGTPLIVLHEITGEAVVAGVLRYLELER